MPEAYDLGCAERRRRGGLASYSPVRCGLANNEMQRTRHGNAASLAANLSVLRTQSTEADAAQYARAREGDSSARVRLLSVIGL
jgi:hypothetical protein